MSTACTPDLQTRRGRFFFWVGLIILPVFWVWWMRRPYFSDAQRRAGWCWTWVHLKLLMLFHEPLGERALSALYGWQAVLGGIALVLWLWLDQLFFGDLILGEFVAPMLHCYARWLGRPPAALLEALALLCFTPVLPAALHLLVEPARRWWHGLRCQPAAE